ncbi:MAG: SUMF1/EgtB/PvdO family nonheme iron enzyme [Deltaproteobacteria bacterium]|nr:SUMF1/EgtB/PvdO family nonheme iron enzyme [Deltaproteobacteria bacterium]
MRGGSWNNEADNCRCAVRNNNNPNNRNNNIGFRCASTRFCGNTSAKRRSPVLHGERERASIESRPGSGFDGQVIVERIIPLPTRGE